MKKNYKLQNTNYKGGGTPSLLKIPNYNAQNYKQKAKGSHGLHHGPFKQQTMTALIKSFCGEVQEGQFLQKAPLLAAGGKKRRYHE